MDWRDSVPLKEQHNLIYEEKIENMRISDPVLWMVFTGTHSPQTIAAKLCWPYWAVIQELRVLKREGAVFDQESPRDGQPMVWYIDSGYLFNEGYTMQELIQWRKKITQPGEWAHPLEEKPKRRTGWDRRNQPESDQPVG